ncbi:hypothetical protein OGAPHI_002063 [Ogataea philodendri]|uniref:Uncharacterized protein n=1 Tax=Ogataea philodendri TaxID=1378263 RepID=A0A9P8PBN1_9ASCO|nr:uncharacterized protein OGAPHI_002063 [Ogataea philodendri]KAH3668309.1 hypothetical protein OGAPHI_002063 [Ogataea philodendri]
MRLSTFGAVHRLVQFREPVPDGGDGTVLGHQLSVSGVVQQKRTRSILGHDVGLVLRKNVSIVSDLLEVSKLEGSKIVTAWHDFRQMHFVRVNSPELEQLLVVVFGLQVHETGSRGVGDVGHERLLPRDIVDEPSVDGTEHQITFAALVRISNQRHVLVQPGPLQGREPGSGKERVGPAWWSSSTLTWPPSPISKGIPSLEKIVGEFRFDPSFADVEYSIWCFVTSSPESVNKITLVDVVPMSMEQIRGTLVMDNG